MSTVLSKRIKTLNYKTSDDGKHVYGKDSFERFGEDLSEVLLSYLTFKDKFRFECVSKQFQRLVFKRQTEINITEFCRTSYSGINTKISHLDSILEKCVNIKKVVMKSILLVSNVNELDREQVFKLIAEKCHHLVELHIDHNWLRCPQLMKFIEVFGQRIKRLRVTHYRRYGIIGQITKLMPNLENISLTDKLLFKDKRHDISLFFDKNQVLFKRLQSFSVGLHEKDFQRFEILVENNKNTLKSVFIDLKEKLKAKDLKKMFKYLSEAKKVKTLRITSRCCDQTFVDHLKQYSKSCQNLKNIQFTAYLDNSSDFSDSYQSINGFEKLKILIINVSVSPFIDIELEEPPKDCPNIMSLLINGRLVRDGFFSLISERLNKLQTINCQKTDITDETFKSLAKLKYLRRVIFHSVPSKRSNIFSASKSELSESVFFDFIQKCEKLKYFSFISKHIYFKLHEKCLHELRRDVIPRAKSGIMWRGSSPAQSHVYPRLHFTLNYQNNGS